MAPDYAGRPELRSRSGRIRPRPAHNCSRIGTDPDGNACIAVPGQEDRCLTDPRDALRALIRGIKAGKADHLL
ncbi:hypothetical protein [Streptomyces sp. MH60]|uniref:hypothetical protein n=1 Tax=Streptomyces sp. MH60 TaxID=1940758 RepID=UPI000CEF2666|nr:hypothetical protein [Streptomyces sp. MH60]PPS89266.1 hypothetical protein BZZ08_01760 [Streptomyces sp. MH60]